MVNCFPISVTSDRLWNLSALLQFLKLNQGKQIKLIVEPEAIDVRRLGLYEIIDLFEFEKVIVVTRNPFEYHDRYTIELVHNHWLNQIPVIDEELHSWNQQRLFMCLYGRPTASRLAIAAHLYQYHRHQTNLHFSADLAADNLEQFQIDKALGYDARYVESIGILIKQLPILLSSSDRYTAFNGYDYSDPLTFLYKDILLDVVVESHVIGDTFFPTEKTLRSIWLKKPFIIFASANYLDYLHQMGFRTFSDFWSEEYDGFEAGQRLSRILSLLDQISAMPMQALESMYWDMQFTLQHNFDLLKTQTYTRSLTKLPYHG